MTEYIGNREDQLDDLLFKESCWLISTKEIHDPSVASFTYLHRGYEYTLTLHEWRSGVRPHLSQEKVV